jgi:predicted DNA-binding protein
LDDADHDQAGTGTGIAHRCAGQAHRADEAYYLRQLIENGIDDLEDYYTAVEVSERIKRGEESTNPLAEVIRKLGLDD